MSNPAQQAVDDMTLMSFYNNPLLVLLRSMSNPLIFNPLLNPAVSSMVPNMSQFGPLGQISPLMLNPLFAVATAQEPETNAIASKTSNADKPASPPVPSKGPVTVKTESDPPIFDLDAATITNTGNGFACPWPGCQEHFNKRFSLKRHMKKHTGERPFLCTFLGCGKRFAEKSTLKRHTRTHTGERPYKCRYSGCNKSFADRTNVRRHQLIHTGEKPFLCPEGCSRQFTRNSVLRKHLISAHSMDGSTAAATVRQLEVAMIGENFAEEDDDDEEYDEDEEMPRARERETTTRETRSSKPDGTSPTAPASASASKSASAAEALSSLASIAQSSAGSYLNLDEPPAAQQQSKASSDIVDLDVASVLSGLSSSAPAPATSSVSKSPPLPGAVSSVQKRSSGKRAHEQSTVAPRKRGGSGKTSSVSADSAPVAGDIDISQLKVESPQQLAMRRLPG